MKRLLLFSVLAIFFNSCSDNRHGGCIEPAAINYESWADFDDGTCEFEADIVFFMDFNSAAFLNSAPGVIELHYYVEGLYIETDDYHPNTGFPAALPTEPPYCYEPGFSSGTIGWDNSISINISFEAIDNTGVVQWYGEAVLLPNECVAIHLPLIKKTNKILSTSLEKEKEKNYIHIAK